MTRRFLIMDDGEFDTELILVSEDAQRLMDWLIENNLFNRDYITIDEINAEGMVSF